jgi:hypothetical protein
MRSVLDYRREPGHKRSTLPSPRSKKSTKDTKELRSGAAPSATPRAPRAAKSRANKGAPRARAAKSGVPVVVAASESLPLPVAPEFLEFLPQKPASMVRSGPRHAVFIDVENTSSEADLTRVLEALEIDRNTTDLTAVGNWRVVGQQLGRMLAQRGAHLLHSAPAPRVPDWSDLWIAVTAGMWLGRAAPGDSICILSDDRAFDAVGDAAARLGVAFRRITYRSSGAAAAVERGAEESHVGGRRRRRRRRGEGSGASQGRQQAAHPPAHAARAVLPSAEEERHAASLDQIRAAIARLTATDPVRGVSLDALTVALKAEGFQRPPGSPRLVTRLRRIKDVELLPNGRVRLVGEAAESAQALPADEVLPIEVASNGAEEAAETNGAAEGSTGAKRRPRRRGGRRRGGRRRKAAAAGPEAGA